MQGYTCIRFFMEILAAEVRRMVLKKKSGGSEGIAYILLRFSLPLILSGVLQQLYNWADAFIVGNVVGELALAAVGATTTVINFYLMAVTGFTLGLSILFAQKYGSGETEHIPEILSTFSIVFGGVFIILSALGIAAAFPLLGLLHTTRDTVLLAGSYLKIIFAGIPFLAVYNVYAAALRGIGDSRAPFLAILFSSAINVGLDILFVAFLHWGVEGAAAPLLRYRLGKRVICRRALRQGVHFGLPPMIQSSVSAFGSLLLQNFMNGFGTQTVAAVTTAYRVDSIILLPIINLGSGISTMTAQSHGGGDGKKARKIFAVGTAMMTVVSLLLTLLIIPTGGHLIALFGAGAAAAEIGTQFFRRIAGFYVIYGLANAMRGYLEGLGDVLYSSIAGILSLGFRIAASYALAALFGNMVIAYAEAFSWVLLLLLYLFRMIWKKRQIKRQAHVGI